MSDLSARLLAAIDERAAKAKAALDGAVILNWPRLNGKATMRAYLHEVSPSSTLRRCEADRRIVETYHRTCESLHIDAFGVMSETMDNLLDAYGLPREHEVSRG